MEQPMITLPYIPYPPPMYPIQYYPVETDPGKKLLTKYLFVTLYHRQL